MVSVNRETYSCEEVVTLLHYLSIVVEKKIVKNFVGY